MAMFPRASRLAASLARGLAASLQSGAGGSCYPPSFPSSSAVTSLVSTTCSYGWSSAAASAPAGPGGLQLLRSMTLLFPEHFVTLNSIADNPGAIHKVAPAKTPFPFLPRAQKASAVFSRFAFDPCALLSRVCALCLDPFTRLPVSLPLIPLTISPEAQQQLWLGSPSFLLHCDKICPALLQAKRVGRGPGSGLGKTCGRGHKGQKARSGRCHSVPGCFLVALSVHRLIFIGTGFTGRGPKVGFEGGQTPLRVALPKRGFINR